MSKVTIIDRRGTPLSAAKDIIEAFSKQSVPGRKVCLIGDMDPLVTENVPEYRALGTFAATLGFGMIISCGVTVVEVFDGTRTHREASSIYFNSHKGFLDLLGQYVREGDTVLFVSGEGYEDVYNAIAAI